MIRATPRQLVALKVMWEFYLRNDNLPPMDWIAQEMGFSSSSGACEHALRLEIKGYLTRTETGKYRFTDKARDYLYRYNPNDTSE